MMKNFDSILTDCLLEKGLKYIRFKVDPTINKGFEADKGYEGFVLQKVLSIWDSDFDTLEYWKDYFDTVNNNGMPPGFTLP